MIANLDVTDRAIIRLLHQDARRTNASIAEEVGLSPSACHRRIKMMEDRGVIRGYTVLIDNGVEKNDIVNVLVQVTLERQTEEYMARFEAAVRKYPEIRECFLMTGVADYWLRVEAGSVAAYETLHAEILSRMPGVTRIHSSVAMRNALSPHRGRRPSRS